MSQRTHFVPPSQALSANARRLYLTLQRLPVQNLMDPKVLDAVREGNSAFMEGQYSTYCPQVTIKAVQVAGHDLLKLVPAQKRSQGELVYVHGGGFVVGSPRDSLVISTAIADSCGMVTWVPAYPLAPEAKWPAQSKTVADCVVALCARKGAPDNYGLVGESAGGAITIDCLHRLHGRPVNGPSAVCLLSPWLDCHLTGESYQILKDHDPLLSPDLLAESARAVEGVIPLPNTDFRDLKASGCSVPPLSLHVGSREVVLSDSLIAERTLSDLSSFIDLNVEDGLWHVWLSSPSLEESQRTLKKISTFFHSYLTGDNVFC